MSTSTFQIQQSGPTAAVVQPPSVQAQRHDARTLILPEAPIAATLVKLAAPNILVNIAQSSVGLVETYFVGKLGTDALARVALVFPVVMLTQMMSAGGRSGIALAWVGVLAFVFVALSVGLVAFGLINVAALATGGAARAMHARKE